jgi:hypothetical protein
MGDDVEPHPLLVARPHHGTMAPTDLAAGGFADCRIETVTLRGCAASPVSPAIGFCQASPMREELEALNPTGLEAATASAAAAIAEQFGEGAFETELCALVIETRR